MALHAEVISRAQQNVLRQLGRVASTRDFYLGGGTGIAIQIGHRRSLALDWFTFDEIPDPLALADELRREGVAFDVTQTGRGTLHGRVSDVPISFLEFRYPLLRERVSWTEYECDLAALEDLATMKLSAIAGRGAKKDFIDLLALGARFPLEQMLDLYCARFEIADVGPLLFGLTYFDDAEPDQMPEMLVQISWNEVKRTLERWVRDYARG